MLQGPRFGLWNPTSELDQVLERMAAPSTAVISLTVTEKGYHRDPASDRLLLDSPEIAADLAGGARTVIGQLVAGLERRRRHGAPVTILCCDNLPENGRVVRALVGEFAARRDDGDGLVAWIGEHVRFPSTMVDRIVPAATDEDLADIAGQLGVSDHGAVVTEPFRQWVIEDDFAAGRPAWERAGAILTTDVRPYELVKLRMLNGSHSTIAYLGALADHGFVADAMDPDGPLRSVAERLMTDDVAPTLAIPDGFDLHVYREELLDRFANPALRHRTLQIAMDGSQKLPQRLLGTVLDRRSAGAEPLYATLGVAAWMRFVSARRSDGGRPLMVEDPLAEAIGRRLGDRREPGEVVDGLLAMREIFSDELGGDPVVRELLVEHLEMLERDGAIRTAQRLTSGPGKVKSGRRDDQRLKRP